MNTYRCDMEKDAPKSISAKNRDEALEKFDCEVCELFEQSRCQGVILVEGEETKEKYQAQRAALSGILGLTPAGYRARIGGGKGQRYPGGQIGEKSL
jgi:hypothetical protein